jgi:hypothetical protein
MMNQFDDRTVTVEEHRGPIQVRSLPDSRATAFLHFA